MDKIHDPHVCCLEETHFRTKDRLKVKGSKKNIPSKWTRKKAEVAILISNKIDFNTKAIKDTQKDTSYYSRVEFIKKT